VKIGQKPELSQIVDRPAPPAAMTASPEWPAIKITRRRVDKLVPYAKNARHHSPEQVAQLARSIERWGWTMPVLIDERGEIIAGHGRVMAAQQLGLVEVPCMTARGWSVDQKRAYAIADNKLPLNASWDENLLRVELADLVKAEFSVADIGFGVKELGKLLAPDEGSSAPQLGEGLTHRVIVDCRDERHQAELLERFNSEGLSCRPLIS
jgi:ParB-like chromosome segregation protein Spo0J